MKDVKLVVGFQRSKGTRKHLHAVKKLTLSILKKCKSIHFLLKFIKTHNSYLKILWEKHAERTTNNYQKIILNVSGYKYPNKLLGTFHLFIY